MESKNPFTVRTPESIEAHDVLSLFVDVFTDFYKILEQGHTFIHGARGTGKSMMFRFMEPDCQLLKRECKLNELDYFGVLVSIKKTSLNLTELARLENRHADIIINEHFLVVHIIINLLESLEKISLDDSNTEELKVFVTETVRPLLIKSGASIDRNEIDALSSSLEIIEFLKSLFETVYNNILIYFKKLAFLDEIVPYNEIIIGYMDFFVPFVNGLRKQSWFANGPIFLMLDDADNLSEVQTQILNTWVHTRTSVDISLKISTQLNYKSKLTINKQRIESPHDFSEINISTVYTTGRDKYKQRIIDIINKRLDLYEYDSDPSKFFPEYEKQENEIRDIAESIKENWGDEGRGHRPGDDALRYARPNYMASLEGSRKSGSTYYYAGLEQIIHVSSGVVRYFLESAFQMFTAEESVNGSPISSIRPSIQHEVLKEQSDHFLFSGLDNLVDECEDEIEVDKLEKLRNLVQALGGVFHAILLDKDRSERKVFSIALTEKPTTEILEIFNLGVKHGYFHPSFIGNKEGTGRTRLYILNRRLAPHFKLDPTGFAGYLFMTNDALREAMIKPKSLLNRIKKGKVDDVLKKIQTDLFDEGDTL